MTNVWSSASTGKPQLSYAERLRLAKENPAGKATTDASASSVPMNVDGSVTKVQPTTVHESVKGSNQTSNGFLSSTHPHAVAGDAASSSSPSEFSASHTTHDPNSQSPGISSRDATTSSSPAHSVAELSSAAPQVSSTKTSMANVWEVRKKQLQDRSKPSEPQSSTGQGPALPSSAAKGHELRGVLVEQRTGSTGADKEKDPARGLQTTEDKQEERKEGIVSQDLSTTVNGRAEKSGKVSKPKKKKLSGEADSSNTGATPLLSDVNSWPVPTAAMLERVSRSLPFSQAKEVSTPQGEDGKEHGSSSRSGETAPPSHDESLLQERSRQTSSSNVNDATKKFGLSDLDVEVLRQPDADKSRKSGKQWISIVPTITHTSSGSSQQSQSRRGKANGRQSALSAQKGNSLAGEGRRTSSNPESRNARSRLQRDSISKGLTDGIVPLGASQAAEQSSPNTELKEKEGPSRKAPMTVETSQTQKSSGASSPRTASSSHFPQSRGGSRTPRGARGRGGSKRAEEASAADGAALSLALAAQAMSLKEAGDDSPMAKAKGDGQSSLEGSTAENTAQSPPNAPRGPRSSGASRRNRSFGNENRRPFGHQVPNGHYSGAFTSGPYLVGAHGQYPFHGHTFAPYSMNSFESTPPELGPQGTSPTTEPTQALLSQIEFYFSHQNLQGDFYLRKSMDAEGFVSVETVASFNRVKHLAGENYVELTRETLQYSKALQFNEDRTKIRKAYDWEPYVLVGGEHAQNAGQMVSVDENAIGLAPALNGSSSAYHYFANPATSPSSPSHNGRRTTYAGPSTMQPFPYGTQPYQYYDASVTGSNGLSWMSGRTDANMRGPNNRRNPKFQRDHRNSTARQNPPNALPSDAPPLSASNASVHTAYPDDHSAVGSDLHAVERAAAYEDDGDDDEPSLGVVAAAGLAGTVSSTTTGTQA